MANPIRKVPDTFAEAVKEQVREEIGQIVPLDGEPNEEYQARCDQRVTDTINKLTNVEFLDLLDRVGSTWIPK